MTIRHMANLYHCHLYGILDLGYVSRDQVASVARELVDGGVDILQLRAKGISKDNIAAMACQVQPIAKSAQVPIIINDHADIALAVEADGVHLDYLRALAAF